MFGRSEDTKNKFNQDITSFGNPRIDLKTIVQNLQIKIEDSNISSYTIFILSCRSINSEKIEAANGDINTGIQKKFAKLLGNLNF